jgi:hypothetical protein
MSTIPKSCSNSYSPLSNRGHENQETKTLLVDSKSPRWFVVVCQELPSCRGRPLAENVAFASHFNSLCPTRGSHKPVTLKSSLHCSYCSGDRSGQIQADSGKTSTCGFNFNVTLALSLERQCPRTDLDDHASCRQDCTVEWQAEAANQELLSFYCNTSYKQYNCLLFCPQSYSP